jgi:hypothetical protein
LIVIIKYFFLQMPKKLTHEFVKKVFEDAGCELLSQYENRRIKLKFRCFCGNEAEIRYDVFVDGTRCNGCKSERTSVTKSTPEYKEKCRANCLEKYGVDHYSKLDEFKEKVKLTSRQKYGADNYLQSEEYKQKLKDDPDLNDRKMAGVMKYIEAKKHTIEYVRDYFEKEGCQLLSEEYIDNKDKLKCKFVCGCTGETNFNTFQSGNRCNNKACKYSKVKETNIERYGKHYTGTEEYREKAKATNLERYGCESPLQNPEVHVKHLTNCFKKKTYTFPSGREEVIQGYEGIAIDELLKYFHEDDIVKTPTLMPEIWYSMDDGKYKKYFPDIYVPSRNIIYEVKSVYTYQSKKLEADYKRKAVEALGFEYNLLMYSDKKQLLTCVKV